MGRSENGSRGGRALGLICFGRAQQSKVSPLFFPFSSPAAFILKITDWPLGWPLQKHLSRLEHRAGNGLPFLLSDAQHTALNNLANHSLRLMTSVPAPCRGRGCFLAVKAPLCAPEIPFPHYLWDAQNPLGRIAMWLKSCPLRSLL